MNKLEKLKQELEELKAKSQELQGKIDELQAEQISEQLKRWRAEENENYYYIESDYECVTWNRDLRDNTDNYKYNIGNYFQTEEEGQKMLEKLKIYTQLKDLALRLNKGKKIDWNGEQEKYYIYYDYKDNKLESAYNFNFKEIGQIYCLDENILEVAKKEIGEENLRKLFE